MTGEAGRRVMPDKRPAPELLVLFACGACDLTAELDAYRGVPTCSNGHPLWFMEGVAIVRDATDSPASDDEATS